MIVLVTVVTAAPLPLALAAALVAAVGMAATKIEWAEETWNPTTGCTRVSPGCDRCYMFSEVESRLQYNVPGKYAAGTAVTLHPRTLDATASVLTPSKVFVNSMSDLLHEAIPDEFVYEVFEAMGRAPWHLYMVLTKRERRLAELGPHLPWGDHVMAGVSVEDAERSYRLDALRECGARRTFVSFEPLLGSVLDADGHVDLTGIDYAIVGGESDSHTPGEAGARPMRPEWAREIRDACAEQGVAFHFKQWGAHDAEGDLVGTKRAGRELDGRTHDDEPEWYAEFMRHACLQAAAAKTSARGARRE
ncbi:DUF5131 family protein [Rubrivirga marina]|nr:phage Gp37/Gp68 family protein [Rubrivirga marina]